MIGATWLLNHSDWIKYFRPATIALLRGSNPYSVSGYYNPPWALIPLIPMALLPSVWGWALLVIVAVACYGFVLRRLGIGPINTLLVLISPPVLASLEMGNIDWLACLGLVLPPWLGILFVIIKPQIGIAVIIYWCVEAWRKGGIISLIGMFLPTVAVIALSMLIYGPWPLMAINVVPVATWNTSLWPFALPVAAILLLLSIHCRQNGPAIIASPMMSPYVGFSSWGVVVISVARNTKLLVLVAICLWLLVLARTM